MCHALHPFHHVVHSVHIRVLEHHLLTTAHHCSPLLCTTGTTSTTALTVGCRSLVACLGAPNEVQSGSAQALVHVYHQHVISLHQNRYILLKERNMLLTLKQEARRSLRELPRPDRLRKVGTTAGLCVYFVCMCTGQYA